MLVLNVCRDQSAFIMIPAPAHFDSLTYHLEECGIEVSTLQKAITSYLEKNNFSVSAEIGFDPLTDHQTFYYQGVLSDFLVAIS